MANLRTNNLCGEGGRNAYDGAVFFDGNTNFLSLGSGVISPFGTNDFTIEFWINRGVNHSDYTIIFNLHTTDAKGFEVAFHNGTIQVYTDTGAWRDTGYIPVEGVYEHIAFQRDYSGNTLKMYANGVEKWSVSNQANYNSTITYVNIGSYNISSYGHFRGYISNLRICTGHLVYSSNYFTPPTSPLTVHYNSDDDETVLLCCQDFDDATQEATGKTITANGSFGQDKRKGNIVRNALDWTGVASSYSTTPPASWSFGNGGQAQYESGGIGGGAESRKLRLRNDGNNSYITQALETVIGQRYFYNIFYEAKNSGLGVRISAGTSAGDGTNLADSFNVGSNTETGRAKGYFTATATTTYLTLQIISATNDASVYWDDVTVTPFNPIYPKVLPPFGTDDGLTFGGAIAMNSSSWMYFPTGRTEERGRGRGFYMLGYFGTPSESAGKRIDYVNIQSTGNTIRFGDLTVNRYTLGAGANSTRGLFTGGYQDGLSPDTDVNAIEYITIATEGDAVDFGDRTQVGRLPACASNDTRCVMASAFTPTGYQNTIDFVTIPTVGNALDFGDLSSGRGGMSMSCNSTTRGIFSGGYQPAPTTARVNNMEYITFSTTGNAQDFGDLTDDSQSTSGGTVGNGTRGLIGLGYVNPTRVNSVDFCTIATLGNASDFGDLTQAKQSYGSCSNSTRGLFFGGQTPSYVNNIDMVIIATTGDATDFGDVNIGVTASGAAGSDSHGGLS